MENLTKSQLLQVVNLDIDPTTNELLEKLVEQYDYQCDTLTWLKAVTMDLATTNTPFDSKMLLDFLNGKVKFSIPE